MIIVIDFGSQTTHLIARRIKEFGVSVRIITPKKAIGAINLLEPDGIILSGGPSSVYAKSSLTINPEIFSLGIPILAICYGLQLMTKLLGGKVVEEKKEYGPADISLMSRGLNLKITKGLPHNFTVWMSHGDEVKKLPKGIKTLGSTSRVKFSFVGNIRQKIYGVQFHPEVDHTEFGNDIIRNFLEITGVSVTKNSINSNLIVNSIKSNVGGAYVLGAVSGGVDSTVAAVLTARAIGDRFIPVFVDNGLMRYDSRDHLRKIFNKLGIKVDIVDVKNEMLKRLKGIDDPEKKRKTIGHFYIEVFEKEAEKLKKQGKKIEFLMQGTIYSDVIESKGSKHSARIKSHHNVGGLPKKMKLKLLEPLRKYYKDEVRLIGEKIGLSREFVWKQPFPGPGYAIRIRGSVTKKRLEMQEIADIIVMEELEKAHLLDKIFQSFPVLTNTNSTSVKGDGRHFGEVVALRIIESKDVMTSTWARLPYDVLQIISSRIVNEIPEVSRVVYDISTKPPATIEWE